MPIFVIFKTLYYSHFQKSKVREDIGFRFKDFGREIVKSCRAKKKMFFWSPPIIVDESRSQLAAASYFHTGGVSRGRSMAVAFGVIDI